MKLKSERFSLASITFLSFGSSCRFSMMISMSKSLAIYLIDLSITSTMGSFTMALNPGTSDRKKLQLSFSLLCRLIKCRKTSSKKSLLETTALLMSVTTGAGPFLTA